MLIFVILHRLNICPIHTETRCFNSRHFKVNFVQLVVRCFPPFDEERNLENRRRFLHTEPFTCQRCIQANTNVCVSSYVLLAYGLHKIVKHCRLIVQTPFYKLHIWHLYRFGYWWNCFTHPSPSTQASNSRKFKKPITLRDLWCWGRSVRVDGHVYHFRLSLRPM